MFDPALRLLSLKKLESTAYTKPPNGASVPAIQLPVAVITEVAQQRGTKEGENKNGPWRSRRNHGQTTATRD